MDEIPAALRALHDEPNRIRTAIYNGIVSEFPQAGGMFPEGATAVSSEVVDALTYVIRTSLDTGFLPEPAADRLRDWALRMRRLGFPPSAYAVFARIVRDVLPRNVRVWLVLDQAASVMERAAAEADLAGVPAAAVARVESVRKENGLHIVRATAGMGVDYLPGQFIPVMQMSRRGVWDALVSAVPSNSFGQLEFHISDGPIPEVGTYVTLGSAFGASPRFDVRTMLVRACSTGGAAAKAIVFHALNLTNPPHIQLILDGDVADRDAFDVVARLHGWLSIENDATTGASADQIVVCGPYDRVADFDYPDTALRICPDVPVTWS